ncbi:UPF0716 protein FxsA [Agrobacterium vitis]|nr:UPF0716 protein FxsA [Agrobacterium vitis]MBE1438919.1 UPF0716 protein FxsA [Agrobacterium vitis]
MRIPAIILLLLPLAEIAGFVLVGQWLGVLTTLALVLGSSILGMLVLKSNGISLAQRLRRPQKDTPEEAVKTVVDGTAQVVGGLLLLLPGFITDVLGLLLLIPLVRTTLWNVIKTRIVTVRSANGFQWTTGAARTEQADNVVDLDAEEYRRQEPDSTSPWKQLPKDEP